MAIIRPLDGEHGRPLCLSVWPTPFSGHGRIVDRYRGSSVDQSGETLQRL